MCQRTDRLDLRTVKSFINAKIFTFIIRTKFPEKSMNCRSFSFQFSYPALKLTINPDKQREGGSGLIGWYFLGAKQSSKAPTEIWLSDIRTTHSYLMSKIQDPTDIVRTIGFAFIPLGKVTFFFVIMSIKFTTILSSVGMEDTG